MRKNVSLPALRAVLTVLLVVLGVGNAWAGGGSNTTYYATMNVAATGSGTVYVNASGTTSQTKNASSTSSSTSISFNIYATANAGYKFTSWSGSGITFGSTTTANTTGSISTSSTSSPGTSKTATASFEVIKVTAAPADVTINATDPSATYPDAGGVVVGFTTSSSNANSDFTTGGSGDSRWTISAWPTHASATSTTFNYKFVGNGSYGTTNRTFTKTVTLKGLNDATVKTCTLTAKYPNPRVIECDEGSTDLTIYPTFKSTDETQEAVEKTAVFDVVYADNANNFSAAFSGATGSGTWTVSSITVDQANQKATVTYTFNGNKSVGTHTAVLTLTANNCQGWDDTSADGGASATVTLTAENMQEATDDAKVIAKDGTTLIYQGDWATAWTRANTAANAGCTLYLLRNVGGLTAYQEVKNTFTLDLNGKILSGKRNGTLIYLNTTGKTLTVKDSKTGGAIQHIHNEYSGTPVCVNLTKGGLILESGTLYCENKGASGRKAGGVICKAGTTFTMNGGKIDVWGYNGAYGVSQESDKNDNTIFNMNNGEITVLGYSDIYGVQAAGKVDIKEGTTISATATYSNCRGITLSATASATAANCYYGQLTMNGGTINSSCTANADGDRLAYGIYFACANTGMGTAVATDGSHANKAASTGTIENATITVSTLGRKAYGVWVEGSYQSKTNNYDVIKIKNTTINATSQYYYTYGVYAQVGVNSTHGACTFGNIELTDCNVSATTTKNHTAYAVYGAATYATIFKDKQPNYYGEYAVASKITINRGTYIAETGTYNAFAVVTGTRARSMYDPETSVYADRKLGGAETAYPELTINDGTFTATAKGTNGDRAARAVSSGGNTTITGGTFKAVSNGRYARAIYGVTGKLKVTGATIEAVANGKYASDNTTSEATGVFADATIQTPTGFTDYCDAEIANCDITATTKVGTGAYGVYINCTSRPFTELYLRLDSINNSWTHKGDGSGTYDIYKYIYPSGDRSVAAKCKVSGGKIKAESQTVGSAYGIYAAGPTMSHYGTTSAECQLIVEKGTNIDVQANTSTACAIQTAGLSSIDNVTAVAKTVTSTSAYGVYCNYNKTTITNSSFTVTGATGTAYGVYANASLGSNSSATTKKIPSSATTATTIIPAYNYAFVKEAEIELGEGNVFDVKTTSGNTAYAVYVHAAKADWTKAETYLNATGSYAYAAKATITGGTYKANAAGTTSYALCLAAKQTQGSATAQPELEVTGGKFKGYAAGGTSGDINANGIAGSCVLKGGVYTYNTNLSKYVAEGYEEVPLAGDRTEYGEGYRYEVDKAGMHGIDVCQIGSTKYKSLEEALQVVTSGQVIYMIANYTMATPGDYVLPANTTLLIPYKTGSGKGATTAIGNSAATTTSATTPSLFRKLTFGNGVNLICYGTIETSAQQKANGQYSACVGMPSGPYGQIQMDEGSHISMESGSRLNCWGYITGKGTINVKNNATVLEGFQLGDWCGGSNATTLTGYSNKGKAFPITHYFYQSIECPITYRPGAKALGSTHVNMSFVGTVGQDAVPLVGTSDAMFIMDNVNASEDTWVMKDYDETTDYCYWTINSGASIGNLIVSIPDAIDVNSADYVLPICSNMAVVLNYGEGSIGQHAVFTPGSKLIINKEGTLVLNNVNVSVLDLTEYTGATIYRASYSPTWGTTNPRSTSVVDAEVFVHGKVNIKGNGGLYTSASGANIHSTNADAGQVLYTTAAQGDKTTYYLKNAATSATAVTVNAAKLRNEDNTYSSTASTSAGDVWVYVNGKWTKKTKEGCFSVETTDKKHYFIQPSDVVEVNYPAQSNHTYTSVTGNRVFVWDADCYWWEVETTPTPEGYYKATTPNHNGKYNYYYYDSSAACWKIKTITVTWNINGSNTNYSVGYGTKPEWLGATPTKASSSSNYVWRWDGWTQGSSTEVIDNKELPIVTENTTFTAHFYEKYYEYNVTFKNSDGTILDSRNWRAGTTPSYEGTPTKNPTAAETFEFNGTWTPAIATVTGSATYTAQYTATPREYTITFLNYDMSVLGTAEVVYNNTPSNATYLAAVAPKTEDPYKPDNSAFSFEFAGWRLQGASSTGFAQVKGDQSYIAQFNQTTKKYKISFVDDDGETVLHYLQLEYGQTPSYTWDNPANKQDVEWNYTFSGWDPEEFTVVEGAQTYTAVYNKTKRKYDITWVDGNGATLKTDQVAYGETPVYSGATPTKNPTDANSFVFNNTWSPAIVAVVGEATYTAQFDATERKYRVTWDAATNGGTCGTEYTDFSYNAAIGTLPIASKEGHTFNGWFTSATGGTQITTATKVTADVTYHAQFTINKYDITWVDGNGATLKTEQVEYGQTPAYTGETPTKTATAQYTYTFNNTWSPAIVAVTEAATYTAQFGSTVNKYEITWVDGNGETLKTEQVEYGQTPAYTGETPTKTATAQYTYTFNNTWSPAIVAVTGAATYTAQFGSTVNEYTITWVDGNGETLKTEQVAYGQTPAYIGETPTKTATAQYTYSFNNTWSPAIVAVTGAATYTAQFGSTVNKYDITWVDGNGETLKTEQVEYGQTPAYTGETPTKTATDQYTYTFNNTWSPAIVSVTGAATYTAQFGSTVNKYTITWVDGNGETLKTEQVEYGTTPAYTGATPTKTATDQYTYTFNNTWSPAIVAVTGAATYTAQFGSTVNKYDLTVLANNDTYGTVTGGGKYDYNSSHTITATPNAGFKFVEWNDHVTNASREVTVTADVTFTATFDYDIANYTVKHWQQNIYDDDYTEVVADRQTNLSGTIGAHTAAEAKNYTGFKAQPFEQQTIVVGGNTINIYYNRETFTISWIVKLSGEIVGSKEETLRYGATPSFGPDPTKEQDDQYEYSFSGWSPTIAVVTADQTYEGSFNATARTYDVTWNNTDGTLILKEENGYTWGAQPSFKGSTPKYSDGDPSKEYVFRGWKYERTGAEYKKDVVLPEVAGDETYTAVYTQMTAPIAVANGETKEIETNTTTQTTTVHEGGMLKVQAGQTLTTTTFILKASANASGQISETGTIEADFVYYDLKLNSPRRHWHAFGVPWAVDLAANPLTEVETGRTFVLGNDYDIIWYNTETRASSGPGAHCWEYVAHHDKKLTPGQGYMIAFTRDVQTVRFVKADGAPILYDQAVTVSGVGEGNNQGINALANPMAYHATLNAGPAVGYVHDGGEIGSDGYEEYDIENKSYVVGKTVYIQVQSNTTVAIAQSNAAPISKTLAPARRKAVTDKEYLSLNDYYRISISGAATDGGSVYVLPEEDKEDKYVVGHDLAKFGMSTKKAQIWIRRYDANLGLHTIAPTNGEAEFPINLYAPTAGEYTIANAFSPDDEYTVYLTRDGEAIWNLSDSPYTMTFNKGTVNGYGIRLAKKAPQIATGVDEAVVDAKGETRKVIINDKVFIIRGDQVYSVDGQLVK